MMNNIKPIHHKWLRYVQSYIPFQKKKVAFYSNFGHGDIGDDAAFYVAQDYFNVNMIPMSKRCYAFNPSIVKALLIGGGGTFRWESPYIPRRIFSKKKWSFPVVLFGPGINCDFGYEYSAQTKDRIAALCDMADYVTVRDCLTAQFLSTLTSREVHVLPDIDLLLQEEECVLPFEKKRETVGIVLTPHSLFTEELFSVLIDVFSDLVTHIVRDEGKDVVFFTFESLESEETKEDEMIYHIMRRVDEPEHIFLCRERTSPQKLLYSIHSLCDMMICMRMHSAVFAANCAHPFIMIAYNMMHTGLADMLDSADIAVALDKIVTEKNALIDQYYYLCTHKNDIQDRLVQKRDSLQNDARCIMQMIAEKFLKNN